jgi:uncharacterized membrane protein YfcA
MTGHDFLLAGLAAVAAGAVNALAGGGTLITFPTLTFLGMPSIEANVTNTVAIYFIFSSRVVWSVALVMAAGTLIGGAIGGRFASRIRPDTLRWVIVSIGVLVAIIYFIH